MDLTAALSSIPGMGKKKSAGGKHTTPRRAFQIPEEWFVVAHTGARRRGQPASWWIVAAIQEKAEREGVEPLPALPWLVPPPPELKKRKGK